MPKDFDNWNTLKKQIQNRSVLGPFFKEREIWWCMIGTNIGFEEDGKSQDFTRPVIILKKFNTETFLGAPLTTTPKIGKYLFNIPFTVKKQSILISQIRFFDARRLRNKISKLDMPTFIQLQKNIASELFSDDSFENFVPPVSNGRGDPGTSPLGRCDVSHKPEV